MGRGVAAKLERMYPGWAVVKVTQTPDQPRSKMVVLKRGGLDRYVEISGVQGCQSISEIPARRVIAWT